MVNTQKELALNRILTVKTTKLRTRKGWDSPIFSSNEIARLAVSQILKQVDHEAKAISAYLKRGKRAEIVFKITGRPLAVKA